MRFFSFLISAISLFGIIGMVGAMLVILHFNEDLPDYSSLATYEPPISTRIHAGDGRLLDEFAIEHRIFVPIDEIPKDVIHAFLSAEDKSFYSHPGIDFSGIARAFLTNMKKYATGKRPEGASTITQQVARNFFLSDEVSYVRKIKEMLLALKLEQTYSKDKILELYLNQIYLGQRSYGVAAAALNYFDKSLEDLTIEEAAFLASLPKAPNNYNPKRNMKGALIRRNWVLQRMVEEGYLTHDIATVASSLPITLPQGKGSDITKADYFVEEVRRELVKLYGPDVFYNDGLSVRTSLNSTYQNIAHHALREGLETYDRRHGWRGPISHVNDVTKLKPVQDLEANFDLSPGYHFAIVTSVAPDKAHLIFPDESKGIIALEDLKWARKALSDSRMGPAVSAVKDVLSEGDVVLVQQLSKGQYALRQMPKAQGAIIVLDPHTGRILAMSGGYSFKQSVFNRATQAVRQPGSSFKPFVYLAALEEGFTPSDLILDEPFSFNQGPGLAAWTPKNITKKFYGPTPLRVGLEKSRNLMTVRLAHHVGLEKIAQLVHDFGVIDEMPQMLSMSLGAGESTLLKMTTGYAMIANGGKKITPTFIDKVQDRQGKVIYKHETRACQGCLMTDPLPEEISAFNRPWEVPVIPDMREEVCDPKLAYQMISMLEGVVQRGSGVRLKELGRHIAGKTGTSNDNFDTWFIGFTPDLVVGVFVGYDEPRSLGSEETGSRVALPIFKNFMANALKGEDNFPFRIPSGLRQVRVNPATGRPATAGENFIWEAFIPGTEPKPGFTKILDGFEERAQEQQILEQQAGESDQIPQETQVIPAEPTDAQIIVEPDDHDVMMGTGGLY